MKLDIDVSDIPTYQSFERWGVQSAHLTMSMTIDIYVDDNENNLSDDNYAHLNFSFTGKYYCCGSINYDHENTEIIELVGVKVTDEHETEIKQKVKELLPHGKYLIYHDNVDWN